MTTTVDESSRGTIITFYSYKGGTGRTMALANVAWILASNGYRVLAVDWDLESPGLHKYLHPFLEDRHLTSSPGVIDMVRDYADAMMQPMGESEQHDWITHYADVMRYTVSLTWPFEARPDRRVRGCLDLLPSGRQNAAYAKAVGTFDWLAFYERLGGNAFLAELARSMRENYDYILIDSRTGVSDGAGICTIRLPDTVVTAFTMNDQSIDGAVAVARSIRRQRDESPVRIVPVPMRVEDAEQLKLEAGRDHARRSFALFLNGPERMTAEDTERYWGEIEIPYKPYYAYEEILAPFGERPFQQDSLLSAYERLTGVLTNGQVTQLAPMDERLRRRWLLAFERRMSTAVSDVFISYAAIDRMWAEWVAGEVSEAGLRVVMREIDAGVAEGTDVGTSRLVVLLSQDYVESPNAAELWKQAMAREVPGPRRFLLPLSVDNSRLPAPFNERAAVDLSGLSEDRAIEALQEAFDLTPPQRSLETTGPIVRRRFPAAEPPVWNVLQRNAAFTGRRVLLEEIRNKLSAADTAVTPHVLHGLGGVGKTQTALEYAHRFRADYDVVWWVSAQQASVARSRLAELAEAGRLETNSGESVSAKVADVLEHLRQGTPYRRWLIVFDNADNPDELRDLIPQGPGHVLITTRNRQEWTREPSVQLVEVGVFTRAESVALLHRRVEDLTDSESELVAERLGDLPLALEQAGAWLKATGLPVSRYLERLEERLPELLQEELPQDYEQTRAAPWIVSMQSLRERSPAAAKLMEVCAFFAPEPIPMSLLLDDRFISVLQPHDRSRRDPVLVLGRAIREIGRYALARIETGRSVGRAERRRFGEADDSGRTSIQVHRLVQAIIRASLTPEEAAENRKHVHAILAAADPKDPDQPDNWPAYGDLWPHIQPSGTEESEEPAVRLLLLDTARYLWKRVDYSTCEEFTIQTTRRWQEKFGVDDPQTLMMRFHLANALRLQARYAEAYDIDRDVYDRLCATVGEQDEYAIASASSLASDMRALGYFDQAADRDKRTLELARDVFGPRHTQTLIAAHNLAISYRLIGELEKARETNETNFGDRREALGEKHPYTLYSKAQYGRDLRETGSLQRSRQVLESAVDEHRQVLGEEHPETLRSMKNLAVTLRKLGEFEEAHQLSTQALARTLKLHGRDHPDVQACEMNLACDESALGYDEAAVRRARPVCQWYRDAMGESHLYTLAYNNNLAIFLRKAGELERAYELTRNVVARLTEVMGGLHPYTLAATINLGNCLYAKHLHAEAHTNDERAYALIGDVLGPSHPDTLAAGSNLVISRREIGDTTGSHSLLSSIGPEFRRVLGDHPNVRAATAGIRLNCDLEPPPT